MKFDAYFNFVVCHIKMAKYLRHAGYLAHPVNCNFKKIIDKNQGKNSALIEKYYSHPPDGREKLAESNFYENCDKGYGARKARGMCPNSLSQSPFSYFFNSEGFPY